MKYLLDTNICIYIIKKKPTSVMAHFNRMHMGDIGISAVTYSELAFGVANSTHPEQNEFALQEFIAPLEIVSFPAEAAKTYGTMRADLKRKGLLLGPLDMLIAAHALHMGSVLVTNNTAEFSRIAHIILENWVEAL